jgi:hypothetical protein
MRNKIAIVVLCVSFACWGHFQAHPGTFHKAIAKVLFSNEAEKGGFALDKISYAIPPSQEILAPPVSEEQKKELSTLFSHSFHFIKAGKQSYAFVSDDGSCVIKFFKKSYLFPDTRDIFRLPPFFYLKNFLLSYLERSASRFEEAAGGYQMGFSQLKEETAILYTHFQRSQDLQQMLCLVDSHERKFSVDLDSSYFVVQKRADLMYERIDQLMQEGKEEEAKEALVSVLHLIAHRLRQGIADQDHGVRKNYGFIGKRAVQIDVGDFFQSDNVKRGAGFRRELHHMAKKLVLWATKEHPSLVPTINQELATLVVLNKNS